MLRNTAGFFCSRKGLALAEIVVALFIVTMALALVGGLTQQVMQLSKSAKQTGAVVGLRNKSIALVRDPDLWLGKLRGMQNFASYNACFPDPNSTVTVINCPTVDPSIFTLSPGLNDVASGYVGVSAPLVDSMGVQIAGTDADPLYLTADGAKCTGQAASCALRAVGYFLRPSPDTSTRPSSVRLVVKVDKNPLHANSGTAAMKPQFISMDVNTQSTSASCPAGSLKLGTLSNGAPYCVPTASSCNGGKIAIGVDSEGKAVCEGIPSCDSSSRYVTLNPSSKKLECTPDPSPCPVGSPYLGNFAGTNEPICSNGLSSCTSGVMMGVEEKNGSLVNKCVSLPNANCIAQNKSITFDGEKFVCGNIRSIAGDDGGDGHLPVKDPNPHGFVDAGSFWIQEIRSEKNPKKFKEAILACNDRGAQLCSVSQWTIGCAKRLIKDRLTGQTEWLDGVDDGMVIGGGVNETCDVVVPGNRFHMGYDLYVRCCKNK